jgi:ABC-type uncharacterized transport system substrate-binding protein
MRRRDFIHLLGAAAAAWPVAAAQAHQGGRIWRIGHVLLGTPDTFGQVAAAFETKLADLGYVAGQNITIVNRYAAPRPESQEEAITALLPDIDLLVVYSTIGGVAARKLVKTLPVVFMTIAAPVSLGLVESLSRPGGNMTGITFEAAEETNAKRLQILREIVPSAARIAVLGARGDPNVGIAMASLQQASAGLGVTLVLVEVTSTDSLRSAFDEMKSNKA